MKSTVTRIALLLSTAIFSQPAIAQEASRSETSSTQGDTGSDIVVTAQKRSERIRDVPMSITAASGEQLLKQGVTSVADLERVAPGFTFAQSQYGAPIYAIRGIGFYNEAVSAQPNVTVYVDQMPLPYSRMAQGAALDLERVEILKGPQGTLFGQNATGGVVNYIAAKPTDELHYGADLDYGRFNAVNLGGFISGPLADNLTARLAVRSEQRGDWINSITRNDSLGQRDLLMGRLMVDWQASDRLKFELNVNGWRDRSDIQVYQARGYLPLNPNPPINPTSAATVAAEAAFPYPTGNNSRLADWDPNHDFRRNDRFWQASLRGGYEFGAEFTLTSLTNYAHLKSYSPIDYDGTPVNAAWLQQFGNLTTFSQELRLEGKIGDRIGLVLGGYYQHDKTVDFEPTLVSGSTSDINGTYGDGGNVFDQQKVDMLAGFGGLDVKILDTLTVQGSVRYTDVRTKFAGCTYDSGLATGDRNTAPFMFFNGGAGIAPGGCITIISQPVTAGPPTLADLQKYRTGMVYDHLNEDNVAWRVGLNWKPTSDFMLYGNISKGYKSGAYNNIPAIVVESTAPVTQEAVLAYEVGFKSSVLDHMIDLDAAFFHYKYDDKQTQGSVVIPIFGTVPALVNIPKAEVSGAEINLVLRPTIGLRLSGGATYVDATIAGGTLVTTPFGEDIDANGTNLPLTPKWQLLADAEYSRPLSSSWSGYIGLNASYRSSTISNFGEEGLPAFKVPSYALVDARIGVTSVDGKWRFQLWGKNIFDKQYWNNVLKGYDTFGRLYGLPATYGISVGLRM